MRRSQVFYGHRYKTTWRPKRFRSVKKFSWRKKLIFFIVLFLILTVVYFLFFSPIFRIKEIKISGNRAITNEEIKNSLDNLLLKKFLIFFNRNNIFLARENDLENILLKDFFRISSIEINKSIFKRTIDLKITERKEAGIFCRGECYYIDEEGVIFEKAPQTSGTLIVSIKDYSQGGVEIGKNVIDEDFMLRLIDLRKSLAEEVGLRVLDFIIEDEDNDLKINTNEGWYLLFDKTRDFKNQLDDLRLVLTEKIKGERKNLEYIDLRIENRAYYK